MTGKILASDYPVVLNIIWTCFGVLAGSLSGAIWSREETLAEASLLADDLSEEEIALVTADRIRRQREGEPMLLEKARKVQ